MTIKFKAVNSTFENKANDFWNKSLMSKKKMGEFALIEIKDCGVTQAIIQRGGSIRPDAAAIKEILRDYAKEIIQKTKGFEYPMVCIKITDGFEKPIYERKVLCKREYWIELN